MIYFLSVKKWIIIFFLWTRIITEDRYHNCGGKEKAGEYYIATQKVLRKNTENKHRNLPEKEKDTKREYEKSRYRNMTKDKKQAENYQSSKR